MYNKNINYSSTIHFYYLNLCTIIIIQRDSLEDYFIKLVGDDLNE
ncbi:hypothetical protein [Clostridium estertheticum]|nr:hypothetical protein [Clostridium estertheticum]